jgi:hypothetical protein
MRFIYCVCFIALLHGCTTSGYHKKVTSPEGIVSETKITNTSLGYDREGLSLDLEKKPDEMTVKIGVDSSSGSESMKEVAVTGQKFLDALTKVAP